VADRIRSLFGRSPAPERDVALRHAEFAAWNTKVLGSWLASRFYEAGLAGHLAPLPEAPSQAGLGGRLCRQADIESDWLRHWCREMRFVPMYHRKVWEDCYALQALWEAGMLEPGRRALGFAVGAEWLPSYFAGRGIEVLATDIDARDSRAQGWIDTGQHGADKDSLFKPQLVERAQYDALVAHRPLDMNRIPPDLDAQFDFCWSVCSLEHCGSIEQGLDFIVNSLRPLKPGGLAVHTTEFNLNPEGPTLERGTTVLFQRRHIDAVAERLRTAGHTVLPIDYDAGGEVLDRFIDLPPYPGTDFPLTAPEPPHLRLAIQGFVSTSIGLIIRKAG
jgi:SAM-dependent methyltransferase